MKRTLDSPPFESTQRPDGVRLWSRCEYHLLKLLTSGPLLPTKKQLCRPALRASFSTTAARKAVASLHHAQWIKRYRIQVFTPPLRDEPLLVCRPGDAGPNFRRLKARLRQQWQRESSMQWRTLRVYLPSRQVANLFGSPHLAIETHRTHAYRTAISHVLSRFPAPITIEWLWTTPSTPRPNEQVVGLRIHTEDGVPHLVGILSEQSCRCLQLLHAHCVTRQCPMELW